MARCDGGYPYCEDCVNYGNPTGECDDCEDGSNYEEVDSIEELSVHELKFMTLKEAA